MAAYGSYFALREATVRACEPIGIQVIGKRFDDLGVLRLSRALEQMRPKQRPWPEVS